MKIKISPFILLCVAMLGLIQACSDDPQCAQDSECFAGEWCNSGTCTAGERPVENNNNGVNNVSNNIQNNSSNNDTIADTNNATLPVNNPTNGQNTSGTNNVNNTNGTHNGTNQGTNNPTNNVDPGVCASDIFATCEDLSPNEPDDSWFDATIMGSSGGCLSGNVITPRTHTATGKVCPRDPGDWFNQIIVPCDERDVIVEVRVTTAPVCLDEEWSIGINRGGANIGCESERVECFDDGDAKVARWIVSPSGSIESWYFGVVNADVSEFEYTAVLEIR